VMLRSQLDGDPSRASRAPDRSGSHKHQARSGRGSLVLSISRAVLLARDSGEVESEDPCGPLSDLQFRELSHLLGRYAERDLDLRARPVPGRRAPTRLTLPFHGD
jgi:hypothetical protein